MKKEKSNKVMEDSVFQVFQKGTEFYGNSLIEKLYKENVSVVINNTFVMGDQINNSHIINERNSTGIINLLKKLFSFLKLSS